MFMLLALTTIYLATPWLFVTLAWAGSIDFLRSEGRSWHMIWVAASLYFKVRDVLDLRHWPEPVRMRNGFLRKILLVIAWPCFLPMLSEDISNLRQFVYLHTFDERPRHAKLMECMRLSETIGDKESAREYRRQAEKTS